MSTLPYGEVCMETRCEGTVPVEAAEGPALPGLPVCCPSAPAWPHMKKQLNPTYKLASHPLAAQFRGASTDFNKADEAETAR